MFENFSLLTPSSVSNRMFHGSFAFSFHSGGIKSNECSKYL